jgi:ATP-dependent exoDNAse (exonuclease V) beta subunit
VKFTNDVFGKAFPAHGIPVSDVVVRPIRQELPGFARALQVWILRGGKQEEAHAALAGGVARMLAEPEAWQVADRASNRLRPLRGGDIAVLVRTNDACATIASKLTKLGVKVALSRPGLMERAECVAAIAGLRWLSDPADTIALAELAHLMEGDSDAPGWLQRALTGDKDALGKSEDAVALSSRRESLAHMTPAEAMDTAIAAINLPQRLRRFGDATARLAALDALRGLARDYEAEMLAARLPATSAGLAAWMAKQNVTEEPASPDPDAVHVTTIHKAKGLEWPVVILAQLDMDASPRLFDSPVAMSEQAKPDPSNPLSGRWLRFWPWPFGQTRKVALADRVGASVTGRAALDARNAEEVRLLYVAMTRARDYLVFAPRVKNGERLSTAWLTKLGEGVPCLPLDGAGSITVAETSYPCGGQILNDTVLASEPPPEAFGPDLPAVAPHGFLPRILHPSASPPLPPLQPRIVRLGGRLPLTGTPDMTALGNALHGFLAADDPSREKSARLEMVAGLLQRWKIAALAPADALTAADRLWAQLAKDWPGAILHREWPLTAMVGRQRLVGQADLIVEHANGFALVDHKSFPGGEEHWPLRCGTYKPQLAAYAKALTAATGRHVGTLLLHLPVGGVLLDITD